MRQSAWAAVVVIALTGCSGTGFLNALAPSGGYQLASNLPYDDGSDLRLDIYQPDDVRNAPVVIFLYGGRWSQGDKGDYQFAGEALTSKRFVAVIPNVRQYPQVRSPVFIADAARAVKWVRSNILRYGGDPNKIFIMGHSSGAHIASMLALNEEHLKTVGGSRKWLKGMIGLAGPYDFLPLTDPDLRDIFGPPEKFEESQPIRYVDGTNPPLLLMHGEDDQSVWIKNSRSLAKTVIRAGGPVETVFYEELSHSRIVGALGQPLRGFADVLDQVSEFINRHQYGAGVAPPVSVQTTPLKR